MGAGNGGPRAAAPSSGREYPARPLVGVGGLVFVQGRVLLIKRRFEPLAGRWSLPGGAIEVGETMAEGLVREMKEETGLDVDVGPVVDVFDRITRDDDGRVRFHYVLVDFLCTVRAGEPTAGSDVAEVVFADPAALEPYGLTAKTAAVVARGLEMLAAGSST